MASSIFRKYIGAKGKDIVLKNVLNPLEKNPLNNLVKNPLHLVIPFANDFRCDGAFGIDWPECFRQESVAVVKSDYQAKVILSIGGNYNHKFDVPKSDNWIDNATNTIANLLKTYEFDGLDLNYSKIDDNSKETFVNNMAGLLQGLKKKGELEGKIISISPTPTFDDCYSKLYSELTYNGKEECFDILVNYKFYVNTTKGPLDNTLKFKGAIKEVLQNYPGAKLLMGYSTAQNDKGIPQTQKQVFFKTYKQMKDHLSGIFVWSEDTSAGSDIEKEAQEVLASN